MNADISRTIVVMGTVVTIQVAGPSSISSQTSHREETIERALGWFHHVEKCCTRFDPESEAMRLAATSGVSVPVSTVLFEAVGFALEVAKETHGAFDPTVGYAMESRGFNREYRTERVIQTQIDPHGLSVDVSYRDVCLDPERKTILLRCPLILDLGAVAKGLAIDMAARELREFDSFAINAGGDLYLGGSSPAGSPWSVGIRHPRHDDALIDTVLVSNRAVCTSGDYEPRNPGADDGYHILDPCTGRSATAVASVTVIAKAAMLADALSTAAFVLGPDNGLRLLDRMGVDGLIVSPTLERYATQGMSRDYKLGASSIL